MKNFIIISLSLLIYLPASAQQCEEGDVYIIEEGNTVVLKECRSGTLSDLLREDFLNFFEANRNDSTFTSTLATALNTCEYCLPITRNSQTVALSVPLSSMDAEIIYFHYIAAKYRYWLEENNRKTNGGSMKCYPQRWIGEQWTVMNKGQDGCRLFQCEGIEGIVALEPIDAITKGHFQFSHGAEYPMMLSVNRIIHHPPDNLMWGLLQWVEVPEGVAYNRYGSCNGPFDSTFRSQD